MIRIGIKIHMNVYFATCDFCTYVFMCELEYIITSIGILTAHQLFTKYEFENIFFFVVMRSITSYLFNLNIFLLLLY